MTNEEMDRAEKREVEILQRDAEHREDVQNYIGREVNFRRAAQEKEGYITDLLTCNQQRLKAIREACDHDGGKLAFHIIALIDNPEPSLATARDQRLDVFTRPHEEDDLTASDLSEQDKFIKDRMDASTKHARDVRLKGPE